MGVHDPACLVYRTHVDRLIEEGARPWFPDLLEFAEYAQATWDCETANVTVVEYDGTFAVAG